MTILKDLAISLGFILLMIVITVVFLIVTADAEEAPLPVTARIVTVEQSCIENGTLCELVESASGDEVQAEWTPATDDVKPEVEMNYE